MGRGTGACLQDPPKGPMAAVLLQSEAEGPAPAPGAALGSGCGGVRQGMEIPVQSNIFMVLYL